MTDKSSAQILREAMGNPEVIAEFVESWIVERERRVARMNEFKAGYVFRRMVDAITAVNGRIDSESFAYFPEREMKSAGWTEFSVEDVKSMLDLCADPDAEWVDPGSVIRNWECPFLAYEYTISGLRVGFMSGQGTAIVIRPDAKK